MNPGLDIRDFIDLYGSQCVVDVRTPSEFARGHIPGAINIPLFSDEERVVVGTIYKQDSPEKAMMKGLEFVGPKMAGILNEVKSKSKGKAIIVHCWRGGKRSASVAWLLDFGGLNAKTLQGGYKAYRRYLFDFFQRKDLNLLILGGKTGSGKTQILHELKSLGEQVVDLEGLAHHKGSAFGWIGEEDQPTPEQFENDLLEQFCKLDMNRRIWLENESKGIGRVYIPDPLWHKMRTTTLINIEADLDNRLNRLVEMYSSDSYDALIQSFRKIERRLGGLRMTQAIQAIECGDLRTAARLGLAYYDKTYAYNLKNNNWPEIIDVEVGQMQAIQAAAHILKICENSKVPSI